MVNKYYNHNIGIMSSLNDRVENGLTLDAKISIAKTVVHDALNNFHNPAAVWSGGKDSTVVLHLIKTVTEENGLKIPPCIFVDHGDHFDETFKIMGDISKSWNVRVVFVKNEDVLSHIGKDSRIQVSDLNESNQREIKKLKFEGNSFEYSLNSVEANHLLKTVPMNDAIRSYQFDALFTGIRWDENPARSSEVFMSQRMDPAHMRVHPILLFTERNIWQYIFKFNIPFHPLYELGYRSIDGKMDSHKVGDKPAWEQDLEHTTERAGRAQDKEALMEKLRRAGYM